MRFKNILNCAKAVIISCIVVLSLCMCNFPAYAAGGTAIVRISALAQPVSPGAQFQINIIIQPINAIAGAQFYLSFNPSLVTVNSVSEGNLLKQNGASTYFNPGQIDNDAGIITGVVGAIITPDQTVSVEDTFAVITMTAGSVNTTCPLILSNVILGDIQAQSVLVSTVNGNIIIGNNANQPPVLSAIGNKTINVDSLLTFTISATDPDGDFLTFSASNLPSGALFDTSSHVFSWSPTASQVGNYPDVQFEVVDGIRSDFESITMSVAAAPDTASGGGGGGGGGDGSAADNTTPIPTTANNIVRNDGVFGETAEVKSEDGTVKVRIQQGTLSLTQDGNPVSQRTITIKRSQEIPFEGSDEWSDVIGNIYDLGPDGSTFDRPIELTFTYNPSLIPAGYDENMFGLATWDSARGKWLDLPSTVDRDNCTVTAKINHFSIYCVLVQARPAAFIISDLTVPAGVKVNDSVNVDALITNVGNLIGMSEVTLKMDGQAIGTQRVTLPGGGNQRISFKVTPNSAGTHVLNIGNLSANLMVNESGNGVLAASEPIFAPVEPMAESNLSSPPAVKVFSLSLLLEIMGGAFLIIVITVSIILLRRRHMLSEGKN